MSLALQPKKPAPGKMSGELLCISAPLGKKGAAIDVNIHYTDEGNGEPLVFVHSAGQTTFTWRRLVQKLSADYRVITFDLAGHGFSDKPHYTNYDISVHSLVIGLFLDALGIESAHFVGFAMGCAYIADFIGKHPSRAGRAIFLSPGGITPQMPIFVRLFDSVIMGKFSCAALNEKRIESSLLECFLDLTTVTRAVVNGYTLPLENSAAKNAAHMSASHFDDYGAIDLLSKVATETLVLQGSDDKWHLSDVAQEYCDALPAGRLSIVRNAGFLLHEEKPEKIIAAISEFIPVQVNHTEISK